MAKYSVTIEVSDPEQLKQILTLVDLLTSDLPRIRGRDAAPAVAELLNRVAWALGNPQTVAIDVLGGSVSGLNVAYANWGIVFSRAETIQNRIKAGKELLLKLTGEG